MNGAGRGRARGANGTQPRNGSAVASASTPAVVGAADDRSVGRGGTRGGGRPQCSYEEREQRRNADYDLVHTRPQDLASKKGTGGEIIKLKTNYFQIVSKNAVRVFRYRVDLLSADEEDRTHIKRFIVHRLRPKLPNFVFDGTMLFCMERLYPEGQDSLQLTSADEDRKKGTSVPVEVVFKLTGECFPTDHTYLHVLNIIKKQANEGLELTPMGRGYYDRKAEINKSQYDIRIWPGYTTSIRQHENGILFNVDVTMKVLRTDTVWQQILKMCRNSNLGSSQDLLKKYLIGAIVLTEHNQKTYRIDDIDFKSDANAVFTKKDSQISYVQYYKERYGITIDPVQQPLLISMPKDRDIRGGRPEHVVLLPQVCKMTGLSDDQRSNYRLMNDIAEFTRMSAPNRFKSLEKFGQRYSETPAVTATLKSWNLEISPKLVDLTGRLLKLEEIMLNPSLKQAPPRHGRDNADWSMAATRNLMFRPGNINNWHVIYPRMFYEKIERFVKEIYFVARALGINLGPVQWAEIETTRTSEYAAKAREVVGTCPNIVMVVLPNERSDAYKALKKFFLCDNKIMSQMITDSKVLKYDKKYKSVATKVAIQMATKTGGCPWAVKGPLKETMIVGYDTYHDTTAKGFSYGAMVATLDQHYTSYTSQVSEQTSRQELCNTIQPMMATCIKRYMETNRNPPKTILFYRDGVGDGQVQQVVDVEILGFKKAVQSVKESTKGIDLSAWNPEFAFIVVSKRINTKFFAWNNGIDNPPSGTVVDDVVTLPERHDFFLISQSVRQGTVNPTSYNIIANTTRLSPDRFQVLTYKLCHSYYNWPGTVRVPAPCQYAHKLAYLMGESVHNPPHKDVHNTLYYL